MRVLAKTTRKRKIKLNRHYAGADFTVHMVVRPVDRRVKASFIPVVVEKGLRHFYFELHAVSSKMPKRGVWVEYTVVDRNGFLDNG